YLTVCVDVYSRMLLGFFITFEPPSLYSVFVDPEARQPAQGMRPEALPADQAAVGRLGMSDGDPGDRDWAHQSPSFQYSMANLGTEVHYAPADTPQYKG